MPRLYVLASVAALNTSDGALVHSELSRDLAMLQGRCSNGPNIIGRQLMDGALFPSHIDHVVAVRAEKEMSGINAGAVITAVQDVLVRLNGVVKQTVAQALGVIGAFAVVINAVPIRAQSAQPRPAFVVAALIGVLPELMERIQSSMMTAKESMCDFVSAATFATRHPFSLSQGLPS